ncbi:family 16 glycosylhydrolase, partial [Acinetobacter sp.]|uniref:glycoside hydrolase family 16 protein n=1 Tax=Acinetobacter sp. TaxID=472 RepID=UPI00375132A0
MLLTASAEELVWFDEFDGTALNAEKWNIDTEQRHSATNCKEAVVVKDGCLHIKPFTKEGKHYTGFITTEGKFESAEGRWEIRAKFGDVSGTWSDAWLYTKSAGKDHQDRNKHGMEIDIFEHRSTNKNNKDISGLINHALHWNGYGTYGLCTAEDAIIKKDDFNIFELKWTKTSYEFYVNDKKTWTSFDITVKPLYFIFSTEIGDLDFWCQPP